MEEPEPRGSVPSRDVFRIVMVIVATLVGVWALYSLRRVLLLLGIAAFLAVAMEPSVTFMQKRMKSRGLAVAAMALLVFMFVAAFIASIVPPIVNETRGLIENLPEISQDLQDSSTTIGRLERRFGIAKRLRDAIGNAEALAGNFGRVFGTVFGFVSDFLVVLILTLYILLNAPSMKERGIHLLPPAQRQRTARITEVVFAKVGGWMEGNILISVIAGMVSFVALLLLGVPYPAALAMWVAIADLIPMVGALIGAVVCVTVAFFAGPATGIGTLIFFLIYQQIENYVIAPRVMNRTVDVSALAVIIAAMIGGTLLGPVGILLAVPAAASFKVIANEMWLTPREQRELEAMRAGRVRGFNLRRRPREPEPMSEAVEEVPAEQPVDQVGST
jgi:predicted PurR-regulated permease PerM